MRQRVVTRRRSLAPGRRCRRLLAVVMVFLALAAVGPVGALGSAGNARVFAADGLPVPGASQAPLYLSQVLAEARACGPGFASAALAREALELERQAKEAQRAPRIGISASTSLHPEVAVRPSVVIDWDTVGRISLSQPEPATLRVDYSRALWPLDDGQLQRTIDELEVHIRRLEYEEALAGAHRAVVEAFTALATARVETELATQALELARDRAAAAGERYAGGQIGVREWQQAQQDLRDAEVALQQAQSGVLQAERSLARLVWGACAPALDDSSIQEAALVDDLDWSAFIEQVQAVLRQPETAWQARALDRNVAYQRALLDLRAQEEAVEKAKAARRVSLSVGADASVPLSGAAPAPSSTHVYVTASLDLSRLTPIQEQQAAVVLSATEARVEQVRLDALDSVTVARMAVRDAEFARDVAERGARQATVDLAFVQKRWEAGFVGPLELAEANLAAFKAAAGLARAEANLRQAWIALGTLLGVGLPE